MTSSVCAASQKWNEARRQEVVRVCAARPLVASIEPFVVNYDEVFCDARGDLILREGGATQLRRASTTKAKVWLRAHCALNRWGLRYDTKSSKHSGLTLGVARANKRDRP